MSGGWISQADRSRWQQRAAIELAAIMAAPPDLPVLAWTVTASGAALSGKVVIPGGRREVFAGWRQALGLGQVTQTPTAHGSAACLNARGVRSGVAVVTATIFGSDEEGR